MLIILSILLFMVAAFLLLKLIAVYRSVDEIRRQFAERMETDTNVGIDISSSDKKIRDLAADLDRQLKLLREKQIRYIRGDQELKAAVTNISHDIRTPLTAIYGYLNLLENEEKSDAAGEYLGLIANRMDALRALAEELFRYSVILSVDSYGEYADKMELSLRAVLEESIAGYYGAIVNAGIRPQISICDQPVKRKLNRQALARIFSNIISNAMKYSDGDFQISLDTEGKICFANQAQKLDAVSAARLTERFFTVEDGCSSTGLGLSIARTLTEKMGGKIEVNYLDGRLCVVLFFENNIL